MITVVLRVVSIFALVGIGFVLNKRGILPKESIGYLTSLLLLVTVPSLNFSSVALVPFEASKVASITEVTIGTFAYYIFAMIASYLIARILKYRPKQDACILMATMTAINCAFMGFPVTKSIFGEEFLFFMVLINALSSVYVFFLIDFHMSYGDENRNGIDIVHALKEMINLPFLATMAGFVIFFARLNVPVIITDFFEMLGAATTPVSMIIIGIQLGEIEIKDLFNNVALIVSAIARLVIFPAVVLAVVYVLPVSVYTKVSLPLATCFPTAAITTSVVHKYKKNESLMAKGIAITTLLSVISVSVWCVLLNYLFIK